MYIVCIQVLNYQLTPEHSLLPKHTTSPVSPYAVTLLQRARPFPDELVAYVLDNVQRDRATLMNCALTCKSWVYLAQVHLFHEVIIDTEAKLHKLVTLLNKRVLLSAHIRILHIKPYQSMAANGLLQMQYWIHEVPEYLATLLTNLHTLHFTRIDHELVDERFTTDFAKFPRVRNLNLTSCKFARFYDFESMVLAYARFNLVSLSMDMVTWGDDRNAQRGPPHTERGSLSLTKLQTGRFCKMHTILPWLSYTRCMTTLKEAELQLVGPEDLQGVGDFLFRLGPSLEHLTLGCKFERAAWLQGGKYYLTHFRLLFVIFIIL